MNFAPTTKGTVLTGDNHKVRPERKLDVRHRPVLDALAIVRKYADSRLRVYPREDDIPVDGIVRGPWLETVLERDEGGVERVNRIAYEVCVLLELREHLRSKEVWLQGANRYRNPDEDLPGDFEQERSTYYSALKLPSEAETFIESVKREMHDALNAFHDGLSTNEFVSIEDKNGGRICLSPLPVQPEPANLIALKARMLERWPMTSLLDVFKEADLRIRFTDVRPVGLQGGGISWPRPLIEAFPS